MEKKLCVETLKSVLELVGEPPVEVRGSWEDVGAFNKQHEIYAAVSCLIAQSNPVREALLAICRRRHVYSQFGTGRAQQIEALVDEILAAVRHADA